LVGFIVGNDVGCGTGMEVGVFDSNCDGLTLVAGCATGDLVGLNE
jgi:hypothetical protein